MTTSTPRLQAPPTTTPVAPSTEPTVPTLPIPELRDIHQPDAVGLWPPAPGWWLLGALLVALLVTLARRLYQHRQHNRYRRQALRLLEAAWQHSGNTAAYVQSFNALIKRVALRAYPRQQVAQLSGKAWLSFLDSSLGLGDTDSTRQSTPRFDSDLGTQMLALLYQPNDGNRLSDDFDDNQLHQLGLHWIKKHRVMLGDFQVANGSRADRPPNADSSNTNSTNTNSDTNSGTDSGTNRPNANLAQESLPRVAS